MTDYRPDPRFLKLNDGFADPVKPAKFPHHLIRFRNDRAAEEIGLNTFSDSDWIKHFGKFEPLAGNLEKPLAQRYHGHQFRHYNPDIGDGRGFLFAQMRDKNNRLMDLGTKGSGTTPYSRSGDGRLTLKGGVREILASEMLEALGTNTSRTFSLIETGEKLRRGDEPSPTRSAVMVRLTHGHIRIGTFQRHAYYNDLDRLAQLTDYCLRHYYNETPTGTTTDRTNRLLELVTKKVAEQAADLMTAGYVHGVLNTDNINITGEIFDFGPWRLVPEMDLYFTAAYFDEQGLYAFGRQPDAIQWNLYQLAGALLDIGDEDTFRETLCAFPKLYSEALHTRMLKRLGIKPASNNADDQALLKQLNHFMITERMPFERYFFDWYGGGISSARSQLSPEKARYEKAEYQELFDQLKSRSPLRSDLLDHAYFRKLNPCTMLIGEVEEIWSHISERDDWAPLYDKINAIREMGDALK